MSETKVCTKCSKEYPATTEYFYKFNKGKYGVMAECKECRKIRSRNHKKENIEYYREADKRYYKEHKETMNANSKKYYEEHKGYLLGKCKEYVENHLEKTKAYQRKWYQENKSKVVERYARTSERRKEIRRLYRQAHTGKANQYKRYRRANKLQLPLTFTDEQWEDCKSKFDYKCAYCGKEAELTQDHFIPLSKNGEYTINNIIPSCSFCNSSKNNKDFFEWYPSRKYYSKKREKKILDYLNYKDGIQQLALL